MFLTLLEVFDANGARSREHDAGDMRVDRYAKIGTKELVTR
jgi:hypothetical protein